MKNINEKFEDYSVKKILEASVVDARFLISEEDFENIKVEFSKSVVLMETSITTWLTDAENLQKYIFIQGRAGTGKSTWLHYYIQKKEFDNIQFVILNMNEECSGLGTGALLRDNLLSKLLLDVKDQLFNCRDEIMQIVNTGYDSLYKCFLHDGYREKKTKQLIGFLDNFYIEGKRENIMIESYQDIIHKQRTKHSVEYLYQEQDIINIYLILRYITLMKSGKKVVFCFDNLDSFSQTFLGLEFLQGIINIDTYMGELLEKVFNFDRRSFDNNIHYIMSLRGINLNLMKTIGVETPDRINSTKEEIDFDNKDKAYEIVKKRLDFADEKKIGKKQKRNLLQSILKLSLDDDTFNKMLPYLFNQNYRGVLFTMNKIIDHDKPYAIKNSWIAGIDNTKFDGSLVAVRGILLSAILQHFNKDNERKRIWSKLLERQFRNKSEPNCDPTRMIMAILLNLCEESDGSNILNLSSICDELKKYPYISKDELKNFIRNFYEHDNDGSLLIIGEETDNFKNKQSNPNLGVNDYYKAEIKNILKFIDQYYENSDIVENDYKISVSYTILSCIEYVYIHYEFYNYCRKQTKYKKNHVTPLFATIEEDKKSCIFPPQSFKGQIESVFNFTEIKLDNMRNFFCHRVCANDQSNRDLKYCNKEKASLYKKSKIVKNRTFHATRIINNHITYIDVFREFILRYNFGNIDPEKQQDFHRETQTYLIDYIEKYVELFYKYSHDSILDEEDFLIKNFKRIEHNIANARDNLKDYIKEDNKDRFIKIRIEDSKQ